MAAGVPILVKIGLKPNGHHLYPDWTLLPLAAAGQTREEKEALVSAQQIEKWRTDSKYGHADDAPDSPRGTWLGMMIVTEEYADQAVAMFPDTVSVMSEAEAKTFWEERAHIGVPEFRHDTDVLMGLKLEHELRTMLGEDTTDVEARIRLALDPTNKMRGVREQRFVKFDQYKADTKLTVIDKKAAEPIEDAEPIIP